MERKNNKSKIKIVKRKNWKSKNLDSNSRLNNDFSVNIKQEVNDFGLKNEISESQNELGKFEEEKDKKIQEEKFDEIEEISNNSLVLESANEKLKNALESQNPKKKKKSVILNLCLLAVNIIFMVFIVKSMLKDINGSVFDVIKNQGNKLLWLLGGVVAYIIFIVVQIFSYKILIRSLANNKSTKLAYDTAIVGRYYDNVTPMAVGGQPMQIVVLASHNVNATVSTGIPLIKLVINSFVSAVLALVFFIFGFPFLKMTTSLNSILILLLEVFGVIGLVISLLVAGLIFLVSSGKVVTKSFLRSVLRICYKMKLVKNYRKTYRKMLSQIEEYKFSMKYLLSNKKNLFILLLLNIIENLVYALMPYFVVMAFVDSISISPIVFMLLCISKYYLCSMASCFIPLPGGTGMMEISFIILFGMSVGENIVWALLGYRFFSYYLILIHGFIHELVKIIKNISKNKKLKAKSDVLINNNV